MRLRGSVLVGVTFLLGATFAWAGAPDTSVPPEFRKLCEQRLKPTSIRVTVSPLSYVADSSRSVRDLTGGVSGQRATLGLTVSQRETNYVYGASRLVRSDGWACLRPQLEISINVGPQRVYVGKEFSRGTCSYNEILAHELRHVAVNQNHAVATAKDYQRELQNLFQNTIYYGSVDELQAEFNKVMQEGWIPRLRDQLAQSQSLHAAIDTPQEYQRNQVVCDGEIPQTLYQQGVWR